jgi:AcrR family transcriptional regulator
MIDIAIGKDNMDATQPEKRGAGGRPPVSRKGDVDARLLEAATRLFLSLGFEGTSCDQVAQEARAGKASIYARYANKTALLAAVVDNKFKVLFDAGHDGAAVDMPLRERVLRAGEAVIGNALQPDAVALLRLMVMAAPRLQAHALDAERMLHTIGVQHVAHAIAGLDAAADVAASAAAADLIDQVLAPALLRALLGADLETLRAAASGKLAAAVDAMAASGAFS